MPTPVRTDLLRPQLLGSAWRRHGAAPLFVLVALVLRELLSLRFGDLPPFLTLYPAVVFATLLCGLWPGVVAVALSVIASVWILPPHGHWRVEGANNILALVWFGALALAMTAIVGLYLRAREEAAERASRDLRESENTLRGILDAATESIWLLTVEGVALAANDTALSRIGLPRQQVIGRALHEVMSEDLARSRAQRLREVARTRARVEFEDSRAGMRLEHTFYPVFGADGRVDRVVAYSRDVTLRKQAEERLLQSRLDLKALAARALEAREDEQARIARDLHDDLGQILTALKLELGRLESGLEGAGPGGRWIEEPVVAGAALVDQAQASVNRLASGLRPQALDILGLGPALEEEGRRFTGRCGVRCDVSIGELPSIPWGAATALYRIAQEALTNVARHAAASRVGIRVACDGDAVTLSVEDDGRGLSGRFDGHTSGSRLGLLGMRERAARFGGEVRLEPGGAGGAALVARLPLRGAPPSEAGTGADGSTERAREMQLRSAERLLRDVIDGTNASIFLKDVEGRYITINKRLEGLLGLRRDQVKGKTDLELYPREVAESYRRNDREVLESGRPIQVEEAVVLADGRLGTMLMSKFPLRDEAGLIYGTCGISQDITGLKESEQRYRLLADNAQDVIWTFDLRARRFTYVSPAIRRLRGLSVEEAVAEPLEATLTQESLARVADLLARIGTPDETDGNTGVFDQPCRDGSVKHVEITTTLLRDEAGRGVGIVGVSRDATERVRAERRLRDRESHLRAILQTTLDGFYTVDLQGRLLEANDAYCAMTGYGRDELLAMHVADIEVGETPAETAAHMERIVREGSDRFETRHQCKDGRVIDIDASVTFIADARKFVCFCRDVTERKRIDAAIRRSEERFRALIEKSTDVLSILDEQGRFQYLSQTVAERLGWTPEELVGAPALEHVHPEDASRVEAVLKRLLSAPGTTTREHLRYAHKNGSWRELEATGRNLIGDPAVKGLVLNIRDVTEQRLLEDQLWQAQKLESVGRLAGGVAHDFNNLLTVILSNAHELGAGADPSSSPELVQEIAAAAEHARDLTRQLLAFARKDVITPVILDLDEVVVSTEKLLRRLLGEDIHLVSRRQGGLWHVRCDRAQAEQVLLNLAVNSRDAMPGGGTLSLATSNVEIDAEAAAPRPGLRPGAYVRLTVKDTGTGMTPEVKARIFEPFFTTKGVGKGTGLGLATVYGIVKQNDGFIAVASEPGRGTSVEILLPRASDAVTRAEAQPRSPALEGSETVLVVEDDPRVRGVTVRALELGGYRVLVARNGREAVHLVQDDPAPIHLLVTDVVMPGSNGREVAEELRRLRAGLQVLYVSGYAQDALAERGALDPRIRLLQKPFTRATLLARVRAILDGQDAVA